MHNTGMLTLTIFVNNAAAGEPPHTLTIHGAHSFFSGRASGSVSAASPALAPLIGFKAVATGSTPVVLTLSD